MNFKKILPRKKVLSIDIGSYEIKVVEGKETKNGVKVDNYFSILTPEDAYMDGEILDKDLIYYVLNEKIKNKKIRTKDVYLTINSSSIITREVTIPKVEEEEIENILKFQIEEYIPMESKDYVVQYKIIGNIYEDNVEKLNMLLIAIPQNIIESHFQLIKDLNLNPLVLDYQPNSIAKIIKTNSFINNTYPTENITFAAVDLGYSNTKVSIIQNGVIIVSRIVEMGIKHVDQNILNFFDYTFEELEEKKLEIVDISRIEEEYDDSNRLVNIVRNSIENLNDRIDIVFRYYLSREIDNKINIILLYGGGANIGGLPSLFSNYFDIPTIKVESFDNIVFSGNMSKYINSIGSIIRLEV